MTTEAITPLRQRMIEDMNARKLCAGTQRGHIRSCKRFREDRTLPHRPMSSILCITANSAANVSDGSFASERHTHDEFVACPVYLRSLPNWLRRKGVECQEET